jgi:hypothetical protein
MPASRTRPCPPWSACRRAPAWNGCGGWKRAAHPLYTAILDPTAAGYPVVALAAIQGDHAPHRASASSACCRLPRGRRHRVPSGDFDYLVRIVAASLADYEALTGAWLGDAPSAYRAFHHFILKA